MSEAPTFTLRADDPSAPGLIQKWAQTCWLDIAMGRRPRSDTPLISRALETAAAMERWRLAQPQHEEAANAERAVRSYQSA